MLRIDDDVVIVLLQVIGNAEVLRRRNEHPKIVLVAYLDDLLNLLRELWKHDGQRSFREEVVEECYAGIHVNSFGVIDAKQLADALLLAGVVVGHETV